MSSDGEIGNWILKGFFKFMLFLVFILVCFFIYCISKAEAHHHNIPKEIKLYRLLFKDKNCVNKYLIKCSDNINKLPTIESQRCIDYAMKKCHNWLSKI